MKAHYFSQKIGRVLAALLFVISIGFVSSSAVQAQWWPNATGQRDRDYRRERAREIQRERERQRNEEWRRRNRNRLRCRDRRKFTASRVDFRDGCDGGGSGCGSGP